MNVAFYVTGLVYTAKNIEYLDLKICTYAQL